MSKTTARKGRERSPVSDVPERKARAQEEAKRTDPSDTELSLSPNAMTVLARRYLKKDEEGNVVEQPEEMFRRVANDIASADKLYGASDEEVARIEEEFYGMMTRLEFLPNSPTLRGAGRRLQQLSGCFVVPVGDSLEDIFDAIKYAALIHKTGGGVGFSFSRLRPRGDMVASTGNIAGGPLSFIKVFNSTAQEITQGGVRMGANMGILSVDHPDIVDFITCKRDGLSLTNFNISVGVTDAFMRAVESDEEYDLINPRTQKTMKQIRAREVFDLVAEMAWHNGDPGVVFMDKINEGNPTPKLGRIESTNPCGEQPLLPYESCNLGSINLSRMVSDGQFDFDRLRTTVRNAVRFLDNVIDRNKYVLPEIERRTRGNRKIGMGVMGFADTLIQLRIPYNSEEGIETASKVMGFISEEADRMSEELAEVRGVFPNFEGSIYEEKELRLRNATRTTIAPTGTIGVIANCSSGIEPLFAIVHTRGTLFDKEGATETLHVVNPFFERAAREWGFYSDELMARIAEQGTCQGLPEVPEEVQRVFVTAHDISPEAHIRMQAAFQTNGVDNAVSKTINMRHDTTIEDVKNAYLMAYKTGCKGITLYRDRSRDVQVLISGSEEETAETAEPERDTKAPRPRPQTTWGATTKVGTGCGSLFVTINEDENGLCEIFARMGRSGGCPACQTEATSRIISISLRAGVEIDAILDQLRGIRCPSPKWGNGGVVLSCPDAIGIAIQRYMEDGPVRREKSNTESDGTEPRDTSIFSGHREVVGMCPECGCPMEYVEGCAVCRMCGFTRCG